MSRWLERLSGAAETVVWMFRLNLWWWLFTALGLGILGAAPATAAAAVVVRRRGEGEVVRLGDFAGCYRREFVRANLSLGPGLVVGALLINNLRWFAGRGTLPTMITVAALVLLGITSCYLGPLYAVYDLPRSRYLLMALRITLARPLWSLLMALVTAAVLFACAKVPILTAGVGMGVWLHACTWLGLRFFAENERRLASADGSGDSDTPIFALPAEPMRLH